VPIGTERGGIPYCLDNQVGGVLNMTAIDAHKETIFCAHDILNQRHDRPDNRYLWRQFPVVKNELAADKCGLGTDEIVEACPHALKVVRQIPLFQLVIFLGEV